MRYKFFLLAIFFFLTVSLTLSQSKEQSWKVFDDSQVAEIRITMNQSAFTWMMTNPKSDSLHECTVHFKNKYIDTTVNKVGIRIRGNTSRDSQKKSFKLSFNDLQPGNDFYNLEKMNLNGEHNDPAIARAKFAWDIFQKLGINASRASHAAVYINNTYMGLYISVENVDDEFLKKRFDDDKGNLWKCLYGASLYQGGSNYTLETNEDTPDDSKLKRLIGYATSLSSQTFVDSLEKVMDVYEFLAYEAVNVVLGSWDDYWYLTNNYYLYHEPSRDKFHWIPYDYDNSFGVDWFNIDWTKTNPYTFKKQSVNGSTQRPLIDKLLANAQYKDFYTHIIDFIRSRIFTNSIMTNEVNRIKTMITSYALADSYRKLDYNFNEGDFINSFGTGPYSNQHVKKGILQYVTERNSDIQSKLSYTGSNPLVYKIDFYPKNPGPTDSIYVYASGFATSGIDQMTVQFHPGMLTVIYFYKMKLNPQAANTTNLTESDKWIGVIPPLGKNGYGRFKVEIKDKSGLSVVYPKNEFISVKAREYATGTNHLLINEIMADNTKTIKDPSDPAKQEYDDWIELYNPTNSELSVSGMYLTDDPLKLDKWQFTQTDLKMKAGDHLIVWCDEQGSQTGLHANFKLSKSGEYIALVSTDGKTVVDDYTFGSQQSDISIGRLPDGSANWLSMKPSPGAANTTTEIKEETLPVKFDLSIYPNPFNPSTTIQYSVPFKSNISVIIYDMLGREVWSFNRSDAAPGTHKIQWQAVDKNNLKISSGVYICKVIAGNYTQVKKIVLSK